MLLSLASQTNDPITVITNDPNYTFAQGLRPSDYISTAINLLLGAAGVVSFVFLLWGGIQWITAGGDKDAIEKARKRIFSALIGLVIVFSVYTIFYIIRVLFGVDLIGLNLVKLGT